MRNTVIIGGCMNDFNIQYSDLNDGNYKIKYIDKTIVISFPDENICRVRTHGKRAKNSIMIDRGYVIEKIRDIDSHITERDAYYEITSCDLSVRVDKNNAGFIISDSDGSIIFKTQSISAHSDENGSELIMEMFPDERFYGFGFQRKTFDARNHVLTFKKEYRWNEATVPYFLSSSGYGFFSANTYDHTFDFTKDDCYSVDISGGDVDFFVIHGPGFKKIIESYTALSGRPHMIPAWGLGLCYVARLFENQEGLIKIAEGFRKEGIPCDMLGVEPGWEKHYYQMKWVWNNDMFPDPVAMIDALHESGYAFDLWESGDAPTKGYMNPEKRKKWFADRVPASLDIGVDFFKQDDPYPRCITSEEMVQNPTVEILLEDDEGYPEVETRNIANTLYSKTVFDEMRRHTGKRAFVIFHSYGASISSQTYPCAWAGDFKLGNGALNASLSGHSMVTQDMRSETPSGIHFGFLMPFVFMDSWAYYLEPWCFSDYIKEMIRFYSRLRVSLFPYLYTTLWQSHTHGLPMLRPMILEYQDDPAAPGLEEQFMLGDSLLVGISPERGSTVYLPKGKWVNCWTREIINSKGKDYTCTWPSYAGGALFAKAGSVIPMTNASDSISLNSHDFLYLDIYPGDVIESMLYEDDGITYGYEKGEFSLSSIFCEDIDDEILIKIKKPTGIYNKKPEYRAILTRVFMETQPKLVMSCLAELSSVEDLGALLYSEIAGWYYETGTNSLYIKSSNAWKLSKKLDDENTFYNCSVEWIKERADDDIDIVILKSIETEKTIIQNEEEDEFSMPKDSEFKVTVNPPERVRLNQGDTWLDYYIYVGYEIISNGSRVRSATLEVSLEIICNDDRDIMKHHKSVSYDGSGFFKRIVVGSPSEPPDILLTLSADGIKSKTVRYNPPNA